MTGPGAVEFLELMVPDAMTAYITRVSVVSERVSSMGICSRHAELWKKEFEDRVKCQTKK